MGLISRVSSRTYRQANMLVQPEDFLVKLQVLYLETKASGTLTVTMKRYDGIDKPAGPKKQKLIDQMSNSEKEKRKVLIRAKTNKKKLATIIDKEALGTFQVAYCKILRSSMDGLKKKEKKKKNTANTQKAKTK